MQEKEVKKAKKRWTLVSVSFSIFVCLLAQYGGKQIGRSSTIEETQNELVKINAPTGFMGAKWLMSLSQVQALFPDAYVVNPPNNNINSQAWLNLKTIAFDRPAIVTFVFSYNGFALILIIVNFTDDKNLSVYQKTHDLVIKEYGAFSEPIVKKDTEKNILISKKTIGKIQIEHRMYEQQMIPIEQVMLFLKK